MHLMDYVWRHTAHGFDFRLRFAPTFHLVEEALAPLPEAAWPARLRELAGGFGMPARIERLDALPERARLKPDHAADLEAGRDRKSTRLNSSHSQISYAVFCLKKKK